MNRNPTPKTKVKSIVRCQLVTIALLVGPLFSGCDRMAMLVKPEPFNAQCDQNCAIPCDPPLDLSDGSADVLLATSKVNRAYLVRCAVRRDACAACIDGLRKAKVIN